MFRELNISEINQIKRLLAIRIQALIVAYSEKEMLLNRRVFRLIIAATAILGVWTGYHFLIKKPEPLHTNKPIHEMQFFKKHLNGKEVAQEQIKKLRDFYDRGSEGKSFLSI